MRHGIGAETGDIGRMKRQQAFIAAMIKKVVSKGTLANPVRLYNFLDAATKSLTTDTGFAHLKELASLGSSLKNIGLDNIQFITVPNEPYEPDPNRLQLAPEANELWRKIRFDRPLGKFGDDVDDTGHQAGRQAEHLRVALARRLPVLEPLEVQRAERRGAQAGGGGGRPVRLTPVERLGAPVGAPGCCYRFVTGVCAS